MQQMGWGYLLGGLMLLVSLLILSSGEVVQVMLRDEIAGWETWTAIAEDMSSFLSDGGAEPNYIATVV